MSAQLRRSCYGPYILDILPNFSANAENPYLTENGPIQPVPKNDTFVASTFPDAIQMLSRRSPVHKLRPCLPHGLKGYAAPVLAAAAYACASIARLNAASAARNT